MLLIDRIRLRRAAFRYAAHGWAIIESDGSTPWWRRRAHPLLLVPGATFDVLEVSAAVGLRVLGTVRLHAGVVGPAEGDARGPVAVTGAGRWMFFVRPDGGLRPELAACPDIVRHGCGSRVPAAPSRTPEGPIRWAVPPERNDWRLPGSAIVQALALDALGALGRGRFLDPGRCPETIRRGVPRQTSTNRRAA